MLDLVKEKKKLVNTVLERKKRWIRRILRRDSLMKELIEGRMNESHEAMKLI